MNYFTDIKSASFKVDEQFLNGNTFNYPLTGQQGGRTILRQLRCIIRSVEYI